jgi:flagellar biosynthesis protein FlhF
MKIKNFVGRDMRDALRLVRREFGVDAVILSTRSLDTGVEVSAAVDAARLPTEVVIEPVVPAAPVRTAVIAAVPAPAPTQVPAPIPAEASVFAAEQNTVTEELRTLRQLLERQLAALAWNDFTRREPLRARALAELTELGVGRDVALGVLEDFPENPTAEQAQRAHYALLSRRIPTCDSPLEAGGAIALIGAAGVGRTSMLAKLAKRWLLEHDGDTLAIVTIDDGHIGSAEQSRSLGRMLGVPSYRFATAAAFADAARCVSAQELVLIDTPALSGDEAEVQALAAGLAEACPALSSMLVLPASFQAGVLEEAVRRAAPFTPRCCAVTRFDEAVSLGGLISTVIRSKLPLALVSDGPRIPEDLRAARAHQLVARAAELAREDRAHADEDLLGRRFGGYVHAAA